MRSGAYAELWGVVDGAVVDAFKNHPDYLTVKGRASARKSVVKRVTGTVLSFAAQYAARGRPREPASSPDGGLLPHQAGEGGKVLPNPHCRIGRVTFKRWKRSRQLVSFNATTNALIASVKNPKLTGGVKG